MKINEKIYDLFLEYAIEEKQGLLYLLSLYFGLGDTVLTEETKAKVESTKIVTGEMGDLNWQIDLFDVPTAPSIPFAWVANEYCKMFVKANPQKMLHAREAENRMKHFFSENPAVRKDDVIEATKMYIASTDPRFIREPHYFIYKGVGKDKICDLIEWVDKYKSNESINKERRSITNILQ